ncbi:non-hydrolyzing UDP-N-acetylglucosamine 2-epimerase [Bacteroides sp. 519]|uniref:non-hydrolyzing UDP-N-acetylglucosamine 2-epimerase n=1 Tax=Bacteroides sp. 519 TaxID=2302937 RepID=UPI0013D2CF52|nr:UDP-N-acetylglucosamine 2-epimerase (non-hydrolyzing) [Bacteroides sp. 519]NDV58986.1 UDP-N-acetylglucosamine 2-epimerase (non-hydrolyzing) [Bacteroides sp. 519]
MKIATIIGARPQFVKAAVISRVFATSRYIEEIIIHTGQHFDANMSDVFFEEMSIPKPHYNLDINGLGHGAMTGQMLEKIEEILIKENPDWVLVYGDTNSTIAGALAAKKLHIKVAHIEAGLRSFNMDMPEEINRILTDRISDILFCPTDKAIQNLKNEGFNNLDCTIVQSGDVMQDAALFYANEVREIPEKISDKFVLCTVHRAENTDDKDRLAGIFSALESLSKEIEIILPIHPRTKAKLNEIGYNFHSSNIHFIDPMGYLNMVYLLSNCSLVMTDSGGLQKEAYFFKKYCITMRDETEWVELIENGFNYLVGSDTGCILDTYKLLINKKEANFKSGLYGNGDSGNIILDTLLNRK